MKKDERKNAHVLKGCGGWMGVQCVAGLSGSSIHDSFLNNYKYAIIGVLLS